MGKRPTNDNNRRRRRKSTTLHVSPPPGIVETNINTMAPLPMPNKGITKMVATEPPRGSKPSEPGREILDPTPWDSAEVQILAEYSFLRGSFCPEDEARWWRATSELEILFEKTENPLYLRLAGEATEVILHARYSGNLRGT